MIPIFLNSFHPLVRTRKGQEAISAYSLPPFIDSSIRREPDLEHPFPAITALCRPKFAPCVHEKDVVVYITVKDKHRDQWRLVSILHVVKECKSHQEAAKWYHERGYSLPNNCMVRGTKPKPLNQSGGLLKCHDCQADWEKFYWSRAEDCGSFLICKPLFRDLYNPPSLSESQMRKIFGKRIPVTQNAHRGVKESQYCKLIKLLCDTYPIHLRLATLLCSSSRV